MAEIDAQFLGKNIIVEGSVPCTAQTLASLVRPLNVRDTLRSIGRAFCLIDGQPKHFWEIEGVRVPSFALPYLALLLVLESDDAKDGVLDDALLARLAESYQGLPDGELSGDKLSEFLLRLGQSQLSFQRKDRYALARTVELFTQIWPNLDATRQIELSPILDDVYGVPLEAVLLLGFTFFQAAREGCVTPYGEAEPGHPAGDIFTLENQRRFLQHLSASYAEIRTHAAKTAPGNANLDKYRFNPLVSRPLVRPDVQPPSAKSPVYLVPCRKFLLDRITAGLVLDFRRGLGKRFNDAFGFAFQEYVGRLLSHSCGSDSVHGEFSYKIKKQKRSSPDWLVLAGERCVVVEVKKSLLNPLARTYGLRDEVRPALKRTLSKAVQQLARFRRDRRVHKKLPGGTEPELVIVTWDDTWWANSILLDEVGKLPPQGVHVMSVGELEEVLAACPSATELYDFLWAKRSAAGDGPKTDMHDWLSRTYPNGYEPNAFLESVQADFFSRWKLPLEESQEPPARSD